MFEPLPKGTTDELERDILARWEEEDLFHRTQDQTRGGAPFVFYEGPPTANGRPGIHHVFARTLKDLICRYRAMTGRSVTRLAGWDTHGLPVEIEVEKELHLSGKPDIERFGVAEFNRRCRESVFRYKADWESLSNRIGYWLDYDRAYVTYTNDYIESVWWLLKQLWEKDLLYRGHKVLPYCSRCGTSLSSHELAMGYETHRSPSIHALFEVADDPPATPPRFLLVWTTTPWTLPSNVAIAVHPDFEYVELDVDGRRVIVERTLADTRGVPGVADGAPLASFPVRATHRGRDLVGLRYRQLLDAVPIDAQTAFRVVAGEFVTNEEGTGLVHMAPAFGADDFAVMQREGLAFVNPVDASGRFTDTKWPAINGRSVFEANDMIAERLRADGKLLGRYEPKGYEHSYPFCWRCDSPLIYYARESWFVRTTAFRERMVEFNRQVNWVPPEVGTGRFGEWLDNNVDWALSRDRYWGTPLPAWICEGACETTVVVGSFRELAERAGRALPAEFDPHKPYIDEITLPCGSCGGTMRRATGVIDAWFDSGAMPFAQWHYPFEHAEEHAAHFPADYICEGLDQTRGWFYSLLAIAAGVEETPAYRNVIVNGLVLDADGRKMSKRLGNVVNPWEAVEEFGADAVRLYLLASSQVWLPKRFDLQAVPEIAGGFLTRLANTYQFLAQYVDPAAAGAESPPPLAERPLIDRWLASRLDEVVTAVGTAWADYDVRTGTRAIIDFVDSDVSQWYVRLNRPRFWAPDATADPAAVATLSDALVTVCRLLAPAAPFLSDAIHRRLTGSSAHLASFPESTGVADSVLNDAMAAGRRLASLGRHAREGAEIRVRQPLLAMQVAVPSTVDSAALETCLDLVAREVNVRTVRVVASDTELVRLRGKANYRSLGKVYGKRTPAAAARAATLDPQLLERLEAGHTIEVSADGETFAYRPEDVVVERDVQSDWIVRSDGPFVVALNPELTDELRREGLAREVVHRVQRLRKEAGYEYTTRVVVGLDGADTVLSAVSAHRDFIAGEVLAREIEVGKEVRDPDLREAVTIDAHEVVVSLRRFQGAAV